MVENSDGSGRGRAQVKHHVTLSRAADFLGQQHVFASSRLAHNDAGCNPTVRQRLAFIICLSFLTIGFICCCACQVFQTSYDRVCTDGLYLSGSSLSGEVLYLPPTTWLLWGEKKGNPWILIPVVIVDPHFSLLPGRNSDPGSNSRLFFPARCVVRALNIYRGNITDVSFLVDYRRMVPAHARRSQHRLTHLYLAKIFKISPRSDSNSRTNTCRIRELMVDRWGVYRTTWANAGTPTVHDERKYKRFPHLVFSRSTSLDGQKKTCPKGTTSLQHPALNGGVLLLVAIVGIKHFGCRDEETKQCIYSTVFVVDQGYQVAIVLLAKCTTLGSSKISQE